MTDMSQVTIRFPMLLADTPETDAATGFSVDAQGVGSFTGLSYSIPAHAKGSFKADIQVMAMTSQNVDDLNAMAMTMLSASAKDQVTSHEQTNASASLSIFSLFGGGASASYSKTTDTMHSMGLTDDQISQLIEKMYDIASQMSHVTLDFTIDNSASDYSVDGDLEIYTISGTVTSQKGQTQYRMLSDKGSAGSGAAPANGNIIPLQ